MISSLQGQTKFKHTRAQPRQHWGLCHRTPRGGLAGEELWGAREAEITDVSPSPPCFNKSNTNKCPPPQAALPPCPTAGFGTQGQSLYTAPRVTVQHGVQSWSNGPRGGNRMRTSPYTEGRADPMTCCCWKDGSPSCPLNAAFPAPITQVTGAPQIPHTANPTC